MLETWWKIKRRSVETSDDDMALRYFSLLVEVMPPLQMDVGFYTKLQITKPSTNQPRFSSRVSLSGS
eukprot:scaffold343_cov94-Cylindrotheca_fusiformis.AAC.1